MARSMRSPDAGGIKISLLAYQSQEVSDNDLIGTIFAIECDGLSPMIVP